MLDMQNTQYHITPGTSEGKRSPRTEWEGGGGGGGGCLPGTAWTLVQLARCGMPRSCPSHAAFWGPHAARSNTLGGGREGWRDVGRGGGSGGRVQLEHESLQRGEAVLDGLVVRIHILANLAEGLNAVRLNLVALSEVLKGLLH